MVCFIALTMMRIIQRKTKAVLGPELGATGVVALEGDGIGRMDMVKYAALVRANGCAAGGPNAGVELL